MRKIKRSLSCSASTNKALEEKINFNLCVFGKRSTKNNRFFPTPYSPLEGFPQTACPVAPPRTPRTCPPSEQPLSYRSPPGGRGFRGRRAARRSAAVKPRGSLRAAAAAGVAWSKDGVRFRLCLGLLIPLPSLLFCTGTYFCSSSSAAPAPARITVGAGLSRGAFVPCAGVPGLECGTSPRRFKD